MTLSAIIGSAQSLEGREAAAHATHRALEQIGRNPPALGLVIASHYHPIQQVLSSSSNLLGEIPLIGFSTTAEMTAEASNQRSVIVILIAGEGLNAKAEWFANFGADSRSVAQLLAQGFQLDRGSGPIFVVADGFNGDAKQFCAALPAGDYPLAGCLAGGNLLQAHTYQIGGRQSGSNGLSAAQLTGPIVMGVGSAHGWYKSGKYYNVTRTSGPWVRMLDDKTVAETYANLFKYPERDWLYPPLNELVRLYPLGIEQEGEEPLLRSPLRMEADGSLRMHTTIPEGVTAHVMVGGTEACLEAARQATQKAREEVGEARPILALALIDVAWQMLFEAQPGREMQAVREALGEGIPLAGGYTLGQITRLSNRPGHKSNADNGALELLNQHIQVVIFAEAKA
ncbi:MAG: FIST C-terminal domain-containing protein [Anaerolineales bacterium]|nr:FIST C-terminal domain-containing protein [Anaerolineales bacterium]